MLAGIGGGLLVGVASVACDRLWDRYRRSNRKRAEALGDGAAHITAAMAVTLPSAAFVRHPGRFVATAVSSAVLIDLDHVIAARSIALIPCMSMSRRPASHSVLTIGLTTYLAERAWPGTQTELALTLGLGSHLVRDIATGGAPLFIPRRVVEVARPHSLMMMVGLAILGRWYARRMLDPHRPRRSDPTVLAPEALIIGSRALRAARQQRRAA
ncbi:MAG: metal-dependent hydrolase [Chloroflexota bacterium]